MTNIDAEVLLKAIFWTSTGVILYAYAGYPLLVICRALVVRRAVDEAEITPLTSMIIAARNEAEGIAAKIENALSLDYPRHNLEIIVASDGSTDGTDEIVEGYSNSGVRLLSLPRRGKAAALNNAVAASSGVVLVFSDATSLYEKDSLRALMRPLADPGVGGVAGNLVYRQKEQTCHVDDGEQLHNGLDQKLKMLGSRSHCAIAASGAIYAVRRELFEPVPEGVTDDFVISTRVIEKGYRLVFAPDAVACDPVTESSGAEFSRKVRVITRGLWSVLAMRRLLNPCRHGFYAIQLFSQKVLRRFVVVPLIALMAVSPLLWSAGTIYQVATVGQLLFYSLGGFAALAANRWPATSRVCTIPFYFCLVNAASLVAIVNVVLGNRIVVWEPARREPPGPSGARVAEVAQQGRMLS